jgi:hypothetical protein
MFCAGFPSLILPPYSKLSFDVPFVAGECPSPSSGVAGALPLCLNLSPFLMIFYEKYISTVCVFVYAFSAFP